MTIQRSAELSPGIRLFFQSGNLFIMDSETMVSNALHESQQEAINEVLKKNSLTEKLTSVKNKVYDKLYVRIETGLETQRIRRLKQLLGDSNILRHEAKLLDLDRQRHRSEVDRRMQPEFDFSYQETHIRNLEKSLGVSIVPCYLDKQQRFPVRLRSVNQSTLTPTVRQARACLRQRDLQKFKKENMPSSFRCVQKGKSTPISVPLPRTNSHRLRLGSISVSSDSKTVTRNQNTCNTAQQINSLKDNSCESCTDKLLYGTSIYEHQQKSVSTPRSSNTKPATKDSDFTPNGSVSLNDTLELLEEDNDGLPDYIDLRLHFFGDQQENRTLSKNPSLYGTKKHLYRRAHCSPTKPTTDAIQTDIYLINAKVRKFMKDLSVGRPKENTVILDKIMHRNETQISHTEEAITSTKAYTLEDTHNPVRYSSNMKSLTMPEIECHATREEAVVHEATNHDDSTEMTREAHHKTPRTKYSWKHINGRHTQGYLHGAYTADDLVLQSLTGIPIRNVMQTPVPLHAASRAMRHTATFKMHKIVEQLIKDRTRYQRHVVEELKKKLDDELNKEANAEVEELIPAEELVPPS